MPSDEQKQPAAASKKPKLTMAEVGLKETAADSHPLMIMFRRDKLATSSSNQPEGSVRTALSYFGRVLHFVDFMIPPSSKRDKWDFFRWPELHKHFVSRLLSRSLSTAGDDNYRKPLSTVLAWTSDRGRWTAELDFPPRTDEAFSRLRQETASVWRDFRKYSKGFRPASRVEDETAAFELEK